MADVVVHDLEGAVFRDERGFVLNPIPVGRGGGEYGHIHVISMRPGVVRGNHVHRDTTEWFCPVHGKARCAWRDESGEVRRVDLDVDRPRTIEIPPGVPHAVEGAGDGLSILVVYQDRPYDRASPDTTPDRVI